MARVEVHLWSGLRALVGGGETVTVEADTIGQMLDALVAAHPALAPMIEAGVSVSIDGRIIASSLSEPVKEGQEIYLMQRLKGG